MCLEPLAAGVHLHLQRLIETPIEDIELRVIVRSTVVPDLGSAKGARHPGEVTALLHLEELVVCGDGLLDRGRPGFTLLFGDAAEGPHASWVGAVIGRQRVSSVDGPILRRHQAGVLG